MKIKDILDRCSESNVGYSMSMENKQLAEFTSNYARDMYGDDWKLILTITYNKPIKNEYLCRTIIKQIFSELKEKDYIIDGIFVKQPNILNTNIEIFTQDLSIIPHLFKNQIFIKIIYENISNNT